MNNSHILPLLEIVFLVFYYIDLYTDLYIGLYIVVYIYLSYNPYSMNIKAIQTSPIFYKRFRRVLFLKSDSYESSLLKAIHT